MSGIPPIATVERTSREVRVGPTAEVLTLTFATQLAGEWVRLIFHRHAGVYGKLSTLILAKVYVGRHRAAIARRPQQEDIMNARLAYLLLAISTVGMSASSYAQSADTSVL